MAKSDSTIETLLRPVVEATGFELYAIQIFPGKGAHKLRIYIDHPNGVKIDDCVDVARQVRSTMIVEGIEEKYELEVSSPGIERPLFTEDHFHRVIGEAVHIELSVPHQQRKRFSGLLLSASDGQIKLEENDGQIWLLPLSDINKAHLIAVL